MSKFSAKLFMLLWIMLGAYAFIQTPQRVTGHELAQSAATPTVVKQSRQKIVVTPTVTSMAPTSNITRAVFQPSPAPLPKDILEQMMSIDTSSLGGGASECKYPEGQKEYRVPDMNVPESVFLYQHDQLGIFETARHISLLLPLGLDSCGWDIGETVTITILRPDGSIFFSKAQPAIETGIENADFGITTGSVGEPWPVILPPNPTGEYTIIVAGKKHALKSSLAVEKPPYSGIYDTRSKDGKVTIYGFKPSERIRIFLYKQQYQSGPLDRQAVAWQATQVDKTGALELTLSQTPIKAGDEFTNCLAVIGDYTFETMSCIAGRESIFDQLPTNENGLVIGISNEPIYWIKVVTGSARLIVRTEPDSNAPEISRVAAETELRTDQRKQTMTSNSMITWWRVKLSDGRIGWVNGNYIVPLRKKQVL